MLDALDLNSVDKARQINLQFIVTVHMEVQQFSHTVVWEKFNGKNFPSLVIRDND